MRLEYLAIEKIKRSAFTALSDRPKVSQVEMDHALEFGITGAVTVRSIKQEGLISYEILDGEEFWIIAQNIGLHDIPAIVYDGMDYEETKSYVLARSANSKAANNVIEKARQAEELYKAEKKIKPWGALTRTANHYSMSKSRMRHLLNLLKLDPHVVELIENGKLDPSKGRLLFTLPKDKQRRLADQSIIKKTAFHELSKIIGNGEKEILKSGQTAVSEDNLNGDTKPKDIWVENLEAELSELVGQEVRFMQSGSNEGALTIRYNSLDELDGVLEKLGYQSY
ncbi:MAG: ParB/RepB/Spo0J family partition protein [Gammaproteobacteria bacterium]|jgi:ParB family chromosome partitioning protein|nr:ParB/RepB/Spo0J family partition protein [Gammaproteobacteria bacterium]